MRASSLAIGTGLALSMLTGCGPLNPPPGMERPAPETPSRPPAAIDSATVTPAEGSVGTIHPIGAMSIERAAHTATLLQDGAVLLAGGFARGENAYTDRAELFHPTSETFSATGDLLVRRCCHSATALPDGRVLIAGGFNGEYLADAELYDPQTGSFTPTGSLGTPRMDHVAVLLDDGTVLLAGGVGSGWSFLASAEIYDPARGTFRPTGDMMTPRESHTATKLPDGRVLITGGHQGRHADIQVYDSSEIYDPASGRFASTGTMTVRRHKHDAVLLADGRVLITGGSDEEDDRNAYTRCELYDPRTGEFTPSAPMPGVRYKHIGTSLLLPDGDVLIAGGGREAVVYHPESDSYETVPGTLGSAPLSRLFSTATLLKDGRVLISGGYGVGQDVSAGAWMYTP